MTFVGTHVGTHVGTLVGTHLGSSRTAIEQILAEVSWHGLFDFDFGYTLSSGNVSLLASRVNGHTVSQASGPAQPAWDAVSPTGRRGATFDGSNDYLSGASALAALIAGTAEFSAFWVVQFSGAGDRVVWGASDSGSSLNTIFEGQQATTNFDVRWRGDTSSSNATGTAHTTNLALVTSTYAGGTYQSWINGTLSVNAAMARSPAVDVFSIGSRRQSGSWSRFMLGTIYAVGIAPAMTTTQRQTIEGLAKEWWGTP